MRPEFFKSQWERLKMRFGNRAMDDEFGRLVLMEVRSMSETGFARACDVFIGSRTHNKAPLLSEFREARLREEHLRLDNEVHRAAQALNDPRGGHGLRNYLDKTYGKGCKNLWEAVEIERTRMRIKALNEEFEPDDAG